MAMPTVFLTVNRHNNAAQIVQECMQQAEKDGLEVFGIRRGVNCVTTKGSRHYADHGRSQNCRVEGPYGIGNNQANYVYILYKSSE